MQGHALSANIHIHFKLLNLLWWAHGHPLRCFLLRDARRRRRVGLGRFHVPSSNIAVDWPVRMESVLVALLHEVDIILGQVIFANLCLSD